MKKALSCAAWALLAAALAAPSLQATLTPAAAGVRPHHSAASAADLRVQGKPRPLPFHGTVKAVDAKAHTLTVGKRVFHLDENTKLRKNDAPIALKDVQMGERVGGSYIKDESGRLHALSLNFKGIPSRATEKKPPGKGSRKKPADQG